MSTNLFIIICCINVIFAFDIKAPDQNQYYCYEPDDPSVDVSKLYEQHCVDKTGDIFKHGDIQTSCCQCIRYECTEYDELMGEKLFYWNITVSELCCLTCNGTVVPENTIIETENLDDECMTVKTSFCRNIPGYNNATIEVDFSYKNCCNDNTGLKPINSSALEPKTCSERTCYYSEVLPHTVWKSYQVIDGCDCCEAWEGHLVPDGYQWWYDGELYECCRGEIVMRTEVSTTPKKPETTSHLTTTKPETTSRLTTTKPETTSYFATTKPETTSYFATTNTFEISTRSVSSSSFVTSTLSLESNGQTIHTDNCYEDNPQRVLQSPDSIFDDNSMTIEKCQKFCFDKNYLFAGVQHANECFCGNDIVPEILRPNSECNYPCTGNSSQMCGGFWRMNIYENPGSATTTTAPASVAVPIKEVEIIENGEAFVQSDSYNPVTKEAVARTPAHGKNKASTTIIQGGSSRSSGTGLMMTVVDEACYAHDLPEELGINPEDMDKHVNQRTIKRQRIVPSKRNSEKKTLIVAKNVKNQVDITNRLDDFNITDIMKEECKGKKVFYSTVDVLTEEEFRNKNNTIPRTFQRKGKEVKAHRNNGFCTSQKYGCQIPVPNTCSYWTYTGLASTEELWEVEELRQFVHTETTSSVCILCCGNDNPSNVAKPKMWKCEDIGDDEQKFSTAYKMGWGEHNENCVNEAVGVYDSNYACWNPESTIYVADYNIKGACEGTEPC